MKWKFEMEMPATEVCMMKWREVLSILCLVYARSRLHFSRFSNCRYFTYYSLKRTGEKWWKKTTIFECQLWKIRNFCKKFKNRPFKFKGRTVWEYYFQFILHETADIVVFNMIFFTTTKYCTSIFRALNVLDVRQSAAAKFLINLIRKTSNVFQKCQKH